MNTPRFAVADRYGNRQILTDSSGLYWSRDNAEADAQRLNDAGLGDFGPYSVVELQVVPCTCSDDPTVPCQMHPDVRRLAS